MKRVLLTVGLLILLVPAAGIVYFGVVLPNGGPPPDIRVASTHEAIARGKYLAENVTHCLACHSTRNWGHYSGPETAGTEGGGGDLIDTEYGEVYGTNITPHALGDWIGSRFA